MLQSDGAAVLWDMDAGLEISDPLTNSIPRGWGVLFDPSLECLLEFGGGGTPKQWYLPSCSGEPPAWLPMLAEVAGGESYNTENGTFESVPTDKILDLRTQLENLPNGDPTVRWARWFQDHPNNRGGMPK
jgi:hypothetical protein